MVIIDHGVALRTADNKLHRVFDIHPAGSQRADNPILEADERLAGFITIAVTMGNRMDVGGGGFYVAKHPHKNVELVGDQIAKGPYPGNLGVGHPTPFVIKPTAKGAVVTIGTTHAGDGAKITLGNLVFQKDVLGVS